MEKNREGVKERSYQFALRIVNLDKSIPTTRAGNVLASQILRSGTSIGANVEEAVAAYSKNDFTFKMNTALREARETHYWLRVIRDTHLLPAKRMEMIIQEAEEIKKILGAIVRSCRRKR